MSLNSRSGFAHCSIAYMQNSTKIVLSLFFHIFFLLWAHKIKFALIATSKSSILPPNCNQYNILFYFQQSKT